jgi:hypothetical protein
MDQLKKVWGWLQRQHFWVLTVLTVLIALGCWLHGANALWTEYKANRGKIDTTFASANSVKSKPFHPNEKVQQAQTAEIAKQQATVGAIWKELYDRQTASVLKWPSNLSEQFRNYISKLNFGEKIPPNLRRHYNNYIRDHFPELPKIVGALEETGEGSGGMGQGGDFDLRNYIQNRTNNTGRVGAEGDPSQPYEEPDFIVYWADQQSIRDELAPRATPSSKRIWKTQEDLWVYEALLTIIADTNKAAHADRNSNAAIRVIASLEVGRVAAQASRSRNRIDMPESAAAAPGGMMGEGMEGEMGSPLGRGGEGTGMEGGGYGGEYGEMGGRGMGAEGADPDTGLFDGRYVGADGAPIPDPGDGNPAAFGTEFKRLPVRMRLWMDQRWLPQLITECANAPLQVEVQEVRINPAETGSGGGYSRGGDMQYGPASGAMAAVEMAPDLEPNMKTVVIQGIVYIFNPPTDASAPLANATGQ